MNGTRVSPSAVPAARRRQRAAAVLAAAALGVLGLTAPAQAVVPSHAKPAASSKPSQAVPAAVVAAERQAKATGKPVLIPSMTTATTQTAASPKGGFTLTESVVPVRVFKSGGWVTIDPTLHRNANGTFSPAAVANDVYLSGGGTGPLATVVHNGQTLSVGWPTALPTPQVTGDTATYAGVLPGVDLKVTADSQGGFSEVLVVKTAQAAANPALRTLTLAIQTPGQTVTTDKHGNLVTRDHHGAPVFFAPAPTMWDSATTAPNGRSAMGTAADVAFREPAPGAHKAKIATKLLAGHKIALTPDATMLGDKNTHYPVFIDPNWDSWSNTSPGFFEAQQGCPDSANSYNNTTFEPYGDGAGYNGWSGCIGVEETYLQFTLPSSIYGTDIPSTGATLKVSEEYSASPSLSATVYAYQATSTFGSGADWNNSPNGGAILDSHSVGPVTSTSAPTTGFNVTSEVKSAGQGATVAFIIVGDENTSDRDYFKRFFVKGTGTAPNLVIQYNAYPKVASAYTSPGTTCASPSTPPFSKIGNTAITLKAQLTDSDPGQSLQAKFTYSHYNGTQIGSYTTTGSVATGGVESWNIGTLPSGDYTWTAQAWDGIDWSKAVTTCHFTVDATAPNPPVPTSTVFPSTDQQATGGTNPLRTAVGTGGTGNFSFSPNGSTDVAKYAYSWGFAPPTVNPPLTYTAVTGTGPTSVTLTPPSPGLNVLYVRSIDSVGNVSATAGSVDVWTQYGTSTLSADGDFNNDGSPDLIGVGNSSNPGLWLYEGNTDGTLTAPLQIGDKGTVKGTGSPSDFNGALVAHGYFSGNPAGNQDVMVRTTTGTPTVYVGTGNTGNDSIFSASVTGDNQPLTVGLAAKPGNTGTPTPDWAKDQQLVSVGAMQSGWTGAWVYPNDNGSSAVSPDLWAIQGDALGYYRSTTAAAVYNPFTVISPTGWAGKTITSAGVVGGYPALWSRDNNSGELDLWTTASANTAAGATGSTKTVMAASGYGTSNYITLDSAGDTGPNGCPQLWGVTTGAQTVNLIPCTSTTALGTVTSTGQTGTLTSSFDGAAWNLWQSSSTQTDSTGSISQVATAALPDGTLHVFTVAPNYGVYDHVRAADGTWAAGSTKIDANGAITKVAAAGMPDGTLHLETLVPGSGVWDRTRSATGTWAGSSTLIDNNGSISAMADAAMPDGTLHVETLVPGSGVWDRTRSATGTWAGNATQTDSTGSISQLAMTALPDGTLHVFTVAPNYGVYDHVRAADGTWAAGSTKIDPNGAITNVAAVALPDGTLHLETLVPNYGVYDHPRYSDGSWTPNTTQVDANGATTIPAVAALPDDTVHLETLVPGSGVYDRIRY